MGRRDIKAKSAGARVRHARPAVGGRRRDPHRRLQRRQDRALATAGGKGKHINDRKFIIYMQFLYICTDIYELYIHV